MKRKIRIVYISIDPLPDCDLFHTTLQIFQQYAISRKSPGKLFVTMKIKFESVKWALNSLKLQINPILHSVCIVHRNIVCE